MPLKNRHAIPTTFRTGGLDNYAVATLVAALILAFALAHSHCLIHINIEKLALIADFRFQWLCNRSESEGEGENENENENMKVLSDVAVWAWHSCPLLTLMLKCAKIKNLHLSQRHGLDDMRFETSPAECLIEKNGKNCNHGQEKRRLNQKYWTSTIFINTMSFPHSSFYFFQRL